MMGWLSYLRNWLHYRAMKLTVWQMVLDRLEQDTNDKLDKNEELLKDIVATVNEMLVYHDGGDRAGK